VISRKVLASIILGVAGVLIMTWRIVRIPAHVVVINQSGTTLERVAIETNAATIELGTLNNSETRRVSIEPTTKLRLRFSNRGWTSPEGVTAGQAIVLYVMPDGHIDARRKLGTIVR
jgi:hypothetical protein